MSASSRSIDGPTGRTPSRTRGPRRARAASRPPRLSRRRRARAPRVTARARSAPRPVDPPRGGAGRGARGRRPARRADPAGDGRVRRACPAAADRRVEVGGARGGPRRGEAVSLPARERGLVAAADPRRKRPRERRGVEQAEVHALTADGADLVRGVADRDDAAAAQAGQEHAPDLEPRRLRDAFGEARLASALGGGRREPRDLPAVAAPGPVPRDAPAPAAPTGRATS